MSAWKPAILCLVLGYVTGTSTSAQGCNASPGPLAFHCAVESGAPTTGPRLGEAFDAVGNSPPLAHAGPDQPAVECTSPNTTAVQLDGTGSFDNDGDALTYTWSAPGIVFDDEHSPTPIGQFPEGTAVVTLTVSDGIDENMDTVSITVVDTAPPVIACPPPLTHTILGCKECLLADDPAIVAWLAQVSATDCDASPTITHDSPACFPLGATTVTFTATDDDMNASQCVANVTIQDLLQFATVVHYNATVTPNADTLTATKAVIGTIWSATINKAFPSAPGYFVVRVKTLRSPPNGFSAPPPILGRVLIAGPSLGDVSGAHNGVTGSVAFAIPCDLGFLNLHWAAQARINGGGIKLSSAAEGTIGTSF